MNCLFDLNFARRLVNCSMASTGCIVAKVRRSMVTACRMSGGKSFSSRRVPDWLMSIAGQTRRSASLRSNTNSRLPVPLNSWKISSSMRLPVSTRQVPIDGQRTAFLEQAGGGEELLGNVHRLDVHAAAHRAAGVADPLVEGPGQTGDGVQEQDHVLAHLGQAAAAFDGQLREPDVAFDVAIEAAGQDLALDGPPHVGHFFRPLVDQQHDQLHVRIVRGNAVADVLQHDRLAAAGRSDDQGPLASAQRREQIHDPGGHRLRPGLQAKPGLGIDGRELVEGLDFAVLLGRHAVDIGDFPQSRSLLPPARLDHAADVEALAKPELLDHAPGNEGIGQLAGVVGLGIAEEAVAVGVHFQHAAAGFQGTDFPVFLRQLARLLRIGVVAWGTHRPVVTATITIPLRGPEPCMPRPRSRPRFFFAI